MRIYVPATVDLLRQWSSTGVVPTTAERFEAPGEDEESEYAALVAAAEESAALLSGAGRRVVVVGEVADPDAALPFTDVAAVHADLRDGSSADGEELAWFATQELDQLLG